MCLFLISQITEHLHKSLLVLGPGLDGLGRYKLYLGSQLVHAGIPAGPVMRLPELLSALFSNVSANPAS